jgi:hypothetical protein
MDNFVIYRAMWKTLAPIPLMLQEGKSQRCRNVSKNGKFCWRPIAMMVCVWENRWHELKQAARAPRGAGGCGPTKRKIDEYLGIGPTNFQET